MVYEMPVHAFTASPSSGVAESSRGTFKGVAEKVSGYRAVWAHMSIIVVIQCSYQVGYQSVSKMALNICEAWHTRRHMSALPLLQS